MAETNEERMKNIKFKVFDKSANKFDPKIVDFSEDDKHVFLQSTGMFDKDGQEVYEGDMLDNGYWRSIVEWGRDNSEHEQYKVCGFVVKLIPNENLILSYACPPIVALNKYCGISCSFKVTGNKFSNPELLL